MVIQVRLLVFLHAKTMQVQAIINVPFCLERSRSKKWTGGGEMHVNLHLFVGNVLTSGEICHPLKISKAVGWLGSKEVYAALSWKIMYGNLHCIWEKSFVYIPEYKWDANLHSFAARNVSLSFTALHSSVLPPLHVLMAKECRRIAEKGLSL